MVYWLSYINFDQKKAKIENQLFKEKIYETNVLVLNQAKCFNTNIIPHIHTVFHILAR